MQDLFDVVTLPLKKIATLLFSLTIGDTNLGSIIVVGMIFCVLISAIMHTVGFPLFPLIGHSKKQIQGGQTIESNKIQKVSNASNGSQGVPKVDRNTYEAYLQAGGRPFNHE